MEEEGYLCSCGAEFDVAIFEYPDPQKSSHEVWFCPFCGSELDEEDEEYEDDNYQDGNPFD